ncbi:MAG: GTP cyclohydrolase I [Candidatus Eiseniibacteriota bacterium]
MTKVDVRTAAQALAEALRALGVPAEGANLTGTPERVAELWSELFAGLDPAQAPDLAAFPNPDPGAGLVLARDLPFHAMCAHHLLPFFGRAHVAYLPDQSVVGLGAIARLVDYRARRPTLQENLGAEIADELTRALAPRGVAVLLEARHLCMEMRGARKRARVETSVFRGAMDDPARREEFLSRLRRHPR